MSLNDDQELVNFLKQNQPIPPPSAHDLEQRIVMSVAPRRLRHLWLVPTAIAATVIAAIFGYQALQPAQQTAQQTTDVEEFIASSWSDSIHGTSIQTTEPSADYMTLVETNKEEN